MTEYLPWAIPTGAFVALVTFVFSNNSRNDKRVNRVYERLDEVKKANDERYTSKEICLLTHKQVEAKLNEIQTEQAEIKSDIKILLRKANGG